MKKLGTRIFIGFLICASFFLGVWFSKNNESANVEPVDKVSDLSQVMQKSLLGMNGERLNMSSLAKELNLINFWATWCAPCREEMPLFDSVYQEHQNKGFQVIGVAIDDEQPVKIFIDQVGISYPIVLAEQSGWDLLSQAGNPKNLLPYSLLVDQTGQVLEQKLGILDHQELALWMDKYL